MRFQFGQPIDAAVNTDKTSRFGSRNRIVNCTCDQFNDVIVHYQCQDIFWKLVGGYLLKQGIGTGGMDGGVVRVEAVREVIGMDETSLEHSRKSAY